MLAMSALSLQALSGGRFVLGIGTSGPQVMEGWHGVRFDRPVRRTRETIEIIRRSAPGERLEYHGEVYTLPLPDGEGRSIRSLHAAGPRARSTSPRSARPTSASPASSPTAGSATRSSPRRADVFLDPIREGAAEAGRDLDDLDLTVAVGVEFTDDVEEAGRRHAEGYAFTFGAMGSATTNFYNDAFARQGYGDDVREVQRLWLAGDRDGGTPTGPDRDRPRHQPHRHRRPRPRAAAPLPRRRHHDAPRRPPEPMAHDLDAPLDQLGTAPRARRPR